MKIVWPGHVRARDRRLGPEVAEQHRPRGSGRRRRCGPRRRAAPAAAPLGPPPEPAAQELLEPFDDAHGHRIHHLLMLRGSPAHGPQPVRGERGRVVEIDRLRTTSPRRRRSRRPAPAPRTAPAAIAPRTARPRSGTGRTAGSTAGQTHRCASRRRAGWPSAGRLWPAWIVTRCFPYLSTTNWWGAGSSVTKRVPSAPFAPDRARAAVEERHRRRLGCSVASTTTPSCAAASGDVVGDEHLLAVEQPREGQGVVDPKGSRSARRRPRSAGSTCGRSAAAPTSASRLRSSRSPCRCGSRCSAGSFRRRALSNMRLADLRCRRPGPRSPARCRSRCRACRGRRAG